MPHWALPASRHSTGALSSASSERTHHAAPLCGFRPTSQSFQNCFPSPHTHFPFCLCRPVGDGVSRAGIIDSVLLGCIPVLFHPGQHLQWPWHWGSWVHRATVTLDMHRVMNGSLNAVEALSAVPAGRIASMQATIARYGHCLHYYREDNKTTPRALRQMPSALDITLQGSWLHSRALRRNFSRADLCTRPGGSALPQPHAARHRE